MSRTIVGIFDSREAAERAAYEIDGQGLKTEDISIAQLEEGENEGQPVVNDNVSGGTMTGGTIGGLAGLVLGMGAIAVPGLGVIAAAGPIAGLLAGAVTGGVVGGLVDLGIPETAGRNYENEIKQGRIFWSMPVAEGKGGKVAQVLRQCGALSVEIHESDE